MALARWLLARAERRAVTNDLARRAVSGPPPEGIEFHNSPGDGAIASSRPSCFQMRRVP